MDGIGLWIAGGQGEEPCGSAQAGGTMRVKRVEFESWDLAVELVVKK
jgi:hypothetical protein